MDARIYKVLLVEDSRADDRLIQRLLSGPQEKLFQFCRVSTYEDAIFQVRYEKWDAILINQDFGSHPGLELVHHTRLWNNSIPILLFSDRYDCQLEYKARKVGASDYFDRGSLTSSVLNTFLGDEQNPQPGGHRGAAFARLLKLFA